MVLDHENLEKAVVDIWNKIRIAFFQNLYQSMPNSSIVMDDLTQGRASLPHVLRLGIE